MVTIFGSSQPQRGEKDYQLAYKLGKQLAHAGFTICNGGYGGTMEAAARGAKEVGGTTIGVTCEFFNRTANPYIDRVVEEKTLVDRLLKLVQLGDAYVVLKGGTGTLLEFACIWEFMNKNVIPEKPIVTVGKFWNNLIATLKEELIVEGLGDSTRYVTVVETPEQCAKFLKEKLLSPV